VSKNDFVEMCKAIKIRIAFIGHPDEPMNEAGPDWSKEVTLLDAAIIQADKIKQQRDDLLAVSEDVREWLETSSLQEVLVHYTDDSRTDALIMGIASHLTRIEAAIAKATEQ